MKKILIASLLTLSLTGCDMTFDVDQQTAIKATCDSLGGQTHFYSFDANNGNRPQFAHCFVNGIKYDILPDGSMYK